MNGKPYCRRCISFKGEQVEHKPSYPKKAPIYLEYELSPEQKELSDKLVENYKKGIDSLVFAVTGSGKTEIVLQTISYVLTSGGTVGFAIPRRDVVIEIYWRLNKIFKNNKVISVYGGHNDNLEGDIICLTTHQLFRYPNYFDLLILDEIDAFPFDENDVLNIMFFRSIKGHYIQMSATPSDKVLSFFKEEGRVILELNARHHHHPLPVPTLYKANILKRYYYLIKKIKDYQKHNKQVFVFAPTIDQCENLYYVVRLFCKQVNYVHSKRAKREKIIKEFKKGLIRTLFTTAVLERGVTVKDLQVIIFNADHPLYDKAALVQISGRVGRKKDAPEGEVIYIAKKITKSMEESIRDIERSNRCLQNMLQRDKTEEIKQSNGDT
ncbi:MAG: DEAD/DEAH box helicase [Bacilli bacterium]|nr:DEAD/DEAH box helicase [Bacilli bacterium]